MFIGVCAGKRWNGECVRGGIVGEARAVYILLWTILARGSNETAIEKRFSRPQVSVKRCNGLQFSVVIHFRLVVPIRLR